VYAAVVAPKTTSLTLHKDKYYYTRSDASFQLHINIAEFGQITSWTDTLIEAVIYADMTQLPPATVAPHEGRSPKLQTQP
jgi:hypothetical protein